MRLALDFWQRLEHRHRRLLDVAEGGAVIEVDHHALAAGEDRAAGQTEGQIGLLAKANADEGVLDRRRHSVVSEQLAQPDMMGLALSTTA